MTAHAYATPAAPARERERQPRLFALPGGASAVAGPAATAPDLAAVAAPVVAPLPGPAPARPPSRTLDAELRLAWTALAAGAPAACIMCGGRMEPLAAGHGGACVDCGTSME